MFDITHAEDATEDYVIQLSTKEARKASARACRHLKPRDPQNCYGSRLIKFLDAAVADILIYLGVTYILFVGKSVPTRYINSALMTKIAKLNDIKGRDGVLRMLRIIDSLDEEMEVKLLSPLRTDKARRSLAFLRSDEFKQERAASRERRKGKPKRRYKSPEANGLRSGMGKARAFEFGV